MADTASETSAVPHHGPDFRLYMIVFGALSVATALSFVINWIFAMGDATGTGMIMVVAIFKACLVAAIFMHLKWDWSKLYFLIIPVFILAVMMMFVLLPDIVLAWN